MLKINFQKKGRNRYGYRYNEQDDFNIWLLYNTFNDFSTSENAFPGLIESLTNKTSGTSCGDLSSLHFDDNKVTIYDRWDEEERTLILERSYLLELAKEWRKLCEKDVPIITIKRDGEIFIIEEGKEE
jgi:hypothetical protein